jgi:hypothetical protein
MTTKNITKNKIQTPAIHAAALLLGLIMPFGIYLFLQNGQVMMTVVCFCFLCVAMGLIAWKG